MSYVYIFGVVLDEESDAGDDTLSQSIYNRVLSESD